MTEFTALPDPPADDDPTLITHDTAPNTDGQATCTFGHQVKADTDRSASENGDDRGATTHEIRLAVSLWDRQRLVVSVIQRQRGAGQQRPTFCDQELHTAEQQSDLSIGFDLQPELG